MYVSMPPIQPNATVGLTCMPTEMYSGAVRADLSPGGRHWYGRLDGGYSVEVFEGPGGELLYVIIRACAEA